MGQWSGARLFLHRTQISCECHRSGHSALQHEPESPKIFGMSRIERVLQQRGGIARRADFLAKGIGRRELEMAISIGAVRRLRKGVYASRVVDPAVAVAARHGGEVACAAALKSHEIWVLEDEPEEGEEPKPIHIWVGQSNREHKHEGCVCKVHREQSEQTPVFGFVGVMLALLQFALCSVEERFFAALESALNKGLIGFGEIVELRRRLPERMRWIVDFASDDADSGLESLLRFRLHLLGISLRSQVWVEGVGRVDFILGDRIILEVDGRLNHDGPSMRHKDLVRDAAAAAQGYETLRFDYAMVIHNWPAVLAAIRGRLRVTSASVLQERTSIVQDDGPQTAPAGARFTGERYNTPAEREGAPA